jgi:hypothetical protein
MEFIQAVEPNECRKMLGQSEWKTEHHYGQDELEKYLEVIKGFEL